MNPAGNSSLGEILKSKYRCTCLIFSIPCALCLQVLACAPKLTCILLLLRLCRTTSLIRSYPKVCHAGWTKTSWADVPEYRVDSRMPLWQYVRSVSAYSCTRSNGHVNSSEKQKAQSPAVVNCVARAKIVRMTVADVSRGMKRGLLQIVLFPGCCNIPHESFHHTCKSQISLIPYGNSEARK